MTKEQFARFDSLRQDFKNYCQKLDNQFKPLLVPLVSSAGLKDTPEYPLQTSIVYNSALDSITIQSQINLIVVGDNPGKDEQLESNQKYLVGQAGKLGAKFFTDNPQLKTDFRENVIILNKTPVHSAKTSHLKTMIKNGGNQILQILQETQTFMAQLIAKLQKLFDCQVWMVGYGELKDGGIFDTFKKTLFQCCSSDTLNWQKYLVFQHFSMNRFTIDLRSFMQNHPQLSLENALQQLGTLHKNEFFK